MSKEFNEVYDSDWCWAEALRPSAWGPTPETMGDGMKQEGNFKTDLERPRLHKLETMDVDIPAERPGTIHHPDPHGATRWPSNKVPRASGERRRKVLGHQSQGQSFEKKARSFTGSQCEGISRKNHGLHEGVTMGTNSYNGNEIRQ